MGSPATSEVEPTATFDFAGARLYKRLTLVAEAGTIVKVFYPVFPPDRHAAQIVAWLQASRP